MSSSKRRRFSEERYLNESRPSVGSGDRRNTPRPGCFDEQENERSFTAPARRYRVGVTTRPRTSAPQMLQCTSPSTDSTTSLSHLRDKLTVLSPFVYNKVIPKVAATPELSAVKEQDEYERLSTSEPRIRCGATIRKKQYHSDSDAPVTRKTRDLEQVVDKHSVSLDLVAALGTSDQSVIKETFEQLYNKNPQVDLPDLLVEEAIKHGQDKDSGIISGKATQDVDSDVVEDTPVEEPTRRVKLGLNRTKHIPENNPTDDSDVVDDTPRYDYLSKKVETKTNKASKNNSDEIEALNNEAVDELFCQQTPVILNNLISPATINKISESLTQQDESDDDCVIIDDIEIYATQNNEINLAIDATIIDCVNNLLDKVCYNLDNCMDLLGEQQQEIDILGVTKKNRPSDRCNMSKINKNTPKSTKDTLDEQDTDGAKRVTLKFKHQKQAPKMNATRQKKSRRPNKVEDAELQGSINTKSPTDKEEQLIRKKRKLYSTKDDDNENQDSLIPRKERRPSSSNESPMAACYKELENAQKSRIRLPRKRRSTQPVISPKTKKLNDMFDKIKTNVVNNEKITLVDKKNEKDLYRYNISSDSDDEAFKKKKIRVQPRVSSSSLESTSKHGRPVKPINYTPYYSSEDEVLKPKESKHGRSVKPINYTPYYSSEDEVLKPKEGKHGRSVKPINYTSCYSSEDEVLKSKRTKRTKRNVKNIRRTNMEDERMRTQPPEVLDTSFVQEKCDTHIHDEPEPALQAPVLEEIQPDNEVDEPIISKKKPQTPKTTEILKIKTEKNLKKKSEKITKPTITSKSKETVTNVVTESATVSPLPGLVVETVPPKADLTSSLDGNLFQKLKKIYTEGDNLSTTRDTQNLLLNNTIDGTEVDMLNEIDDHQNLKKNWSKYYDSAKPSTKNVHTMNISDVLSEESIATCGDSPITGHNNPDEPPPNLDTMNEIFQHRDVDIEGRRRSIAEFLVKMRNQTITSKAAANTSPILGMIGEVSISRVSPDDSPRSNSVRKQPNAKSIDTSSDIGSNKTEPRENLPSKDITRTPTKDNAPSDKLPVKSNPKLRGLSSASGSDISNPRVLIERMSSADIESLLNPATPKSKTSASRVLSLEKYGKIVTPNRSSTTRSSVPRLMLDRVSSDEINKWLPMPEREVIDEPRIPRNVSTRRRSSVKPCATCEQFKPEISPVKLNFDVVDLTRVTRSKTRTMKSDRSNKLRTESDVPMKKQVNIDKGINSQETAAKEAADENPSQISRSVASVESWIRRNAAAEWANTDDIAAIQEKLLRVVMETLETRLVEINESNGEAIQAYLLKHHEELLCLREELTRLIEDNGRMQEYLLKHQEESLRRNGEICRKAKTIEEKIDALMKINTDRACALIGADAEKKAKMVDLLKEDIKRICK